MAGEEILKNLRTALEGAAVAVGSAEAPPPPLEVPPIAEVVEPPPRKRPGFESLVEATRQQLEAVAEKFKQATSETAKRIVGDPEKTAPRDARVLEIVKDLLTADEETAADPAFLRKNAEKLAGVVEESGFNSVSGREARRYLHNIVLEAPTLQYLELGVYPPIEGGSGANPAVEEVFRDDGDPLAGTPLEEKLSRYKRLLRLDSGALHDTHKIASYINEIKETGIDHGMPEEQVKDAIRRLQNVISETTRYQEENSPSRGASLHWDLDKIKDLPGADREYDREKVFSFRTFREGDLNLLRKGVEGERQWFYEFTDKIYGFGKERAQPSLQDQYKWDEFEEFMKWKYGKNSASNLAEYQYHWAERSKHEFIVKGLLFQPGDIRDRIRSLRLMTGSDLDYYLKNFEYSNYATSLYEQTVMDLMAEKRTKYDEALRWLADIDPDEKMARDELYIKLKELNSAQVAVKDPNTGEVVKDPKTGEPIMKIGDLSAERQQKMYKIKQKFDTVGEGVMLWDDDLQTYTETYLEIENIDKELKRLRSKPDQTAEDGQRIEELTQKQNRKWEVYQKSIEKFSEGDDRQTLEDLRGLSPVDIEVRKRLITYLEAQGIKPKPYQIRMALWAARQASIGSGHVIAIGAFQSIEPGRTPDSVLHRGHHVEGLVDAYKESQGKAVMRAPAFEDLQRFYNPEVFAHRFNMLDEMGERARRFLTLSHLKEKGYDWRKMKITQTDAWKELGHEHGITEEDRLARATLETIEQDMGISFTQLLGPSFFGGGGDFDASGWRLEKGVLDQIRQKYLELKKEYPNDARLDNLALGIQLITAGKDEEAKKRIVDRMMRRTPSKLFQIAPIQRDQLLRDKGISFDSEWKPYVQRALSMAELKISTDNDLAVANIDFGKPGDFEKHVAPYLRQLGAPSERFAAYQSVIKEFQDTLMHKRDKREGMHETMLEAIAGGKFPMTLSLSDFDWKDANFFQLGTVAMDRRGRDNEGMAAARDIMHDILYQTEFLSPNDPLETLKKIKELRKTVNSYADSNVAEGVAKEVLRVFIEMNRNRAIHGKGPFDLVKLTQWIPGLQTLMRHYGEVDYRDARDNKLLNAITRDAWKNFADKTIMHWPHTVAEAISYSVRYTGAEGNAFDELKIAEIIATAQDMGMFTAHPEYASDLRKEFHALFSSRVWNIVRKYWWVIIIATISLAATKAIEDEQKRHG